MKSKEELLKIKEEVISIKNKLTELTEDELSEVTGGLLPIIFASQNESKRPDENGSALFREDDSADKDFLNRPQHETIDIRGLETIGPYPYSK